MTWRDQLRQAKFRGVPFSVQSAEGAFGRRTSLHEYPLRDRPYVEDLGRKARTLTIEAFVLGDDYMVARDRLLTAIEAAGPGTLVHPFLGEMRGSVTDAKLRETTAEGGMAVFTIEFVESGEATFPNALASSDAAMLAAGDAATAASTASFERDYAVVSKPEFIAGEAQKLLTSALDIMNAAAATVRSNADQVAALANQVTLAKQTLISIIYAPASAAQALVANIKQLVREVAYGPREALQLARVFFRFGTNLPNVPTTTAGRRQQAANQAAMSQLARVVSLAEGARAASRIEFESFQEADAVRAELAEQLDELMEGGLADDVFEALRSLRAVTVRDITERGADLARVVTYTPGTTVPALVVAYALYGDATLEADVVARNRVRHPGFLPGAQPLEVLADA